MVILTDDPAGEAGLAVEPRWVHNPDDSPVLPELLKGAAARRAGVLLVALSPTTRSRVADLAHDVLLALGAQIPATAGNSRMRTSDLECFALARLCGHRPRHVVLDRGHRIAPRLVDAVRAWCAHIGAALWLLTPTPGEDAVDSRRHRDRLLALADTSRSAEQPSGGATWLPELAIAALPDTDFPLFRIDCYRRRPDLFLAIDAVFTTTFTQVREHPLVVRAGALRTDQACLDLVTAVLADQLTVDRPPAPVRLIRLRATQAALWRHHNMLLRWSPYSSLPNPARHLPGPLLSRQSTDAVTAIADPARAAVHALVTLLESSPYHLAGLPADTLSVDPEPRLHFGEAHLHVPPDTHPLFRTYHCYRHHQRHRHSTGPGTDDDRAALLTHCGRRASPQTLHALLRDAGTHWHTDEGLPVTSELLRAPHVRWPARWLGARSLFLHSNLIGRP
ncbi:hypothetical protein [Lentzea sp. NPDC003310]|uniref:hypothetical protein n=1 Tax=Lentzea sp. NPDC003310 TaxID=3154447 RepID=UPI0033A594B8